MISLYLLFMMWLSSCQKSAPPGPSVLLIAIEGLSGANFSCNSFDEAERSGFQILCNEAVRFTHAFTPSPMAQAGLGSILTGELPIENGLRDNGRTFLTAKKETLAEKLILKSTRTFFVASAPTVKRYSRLHQGFESFNDDYGLSPSAIYRPIGESFVIFKNWLKNEVTLAPFFAVIHVSDLLFPQVVTQTELLEPRPRGFEGQFEEVDENLFLLFTHLKQNQLWNKSYIILTGLNGTTDTTRFNENPGSNLFTENVSVPLFIKSLKGREEIPHQWKVDAHVTLPDVGLTLEEIFSVPSTNNRTNTYKSASLLALIRGKSDVRFTNRPIMIESAWSDWALNNLTRFSVRDNQWLAIFDYNPLLYNTLTDRTEVNRISLKDSSYQTTLDELASVFTDPILQGYEKPDATLNEEFLFARLLVENEGRAVDSFLGQIQTVVKSNPSSETIRWLLIEQLARQKRWELIEEFNKTWKDPIVEAVLQFRKGTSTVKSDFPCLNLILGSQTSPKANIKTHDCGNKDFQLLYQWLTDLSVKKDLSLERFSIVYRQHALQLKLIFFDLSRGGVVLGANTKKLKDIVTIRLLLSMPHFQKEHSILEKRLGPA